MDDWLTEFRAAFFPLEALPPIERLTHFLDKRLPSTISLPRKLLERWSSAFPNLPRRLFDIKGDISCKAMKRHLVQMLECSSGTGESTASCIWFWDTLIRRVFEIVLLDVHVERGASGLRPDMMLFLDNVCVFRGVEGAPGSSVVELWRTLEEETSWIFGDDVPYVFGYPVVRDFAELHALSPDPIDRTKIKRHLLARFNLEHQGQRFRLLLALLNLCRLIPTVVSACSQLSRDEFATLQRSEDVVIRMNTTSVEQCFLKYDIERVEHLHRLHSDIRRLNVPNIYRIRKIESNATVFEPRGLLEQPQTILHRRWLSRNTIRPWTYGRSGT